MDLLAANGIYACVATATASPPAWMSTKYPDVLAVDAEGKTYYPGARQHYSPCSPTYRRLAAALVKQFAKRYAQHPALAAWHAAVEAQPAFAASQAPRDDLLALYRMFLGNNYFERAGVTVPKTPGAAEGGATRRSLAALPLLFLPVRGCSVPGNTDTRVPPGEPCTPLWQPAGAAEARAVQRLRDTKGDASEADAKD
jgi:hypothetical protein